MLKEKMYSHHFHQAAHALLVGQTDQQFQAGLLHQPVQLGLLVHSDQVNLFLHVFLLCLMFLVALVIPSVPSVLILQLVLIGQANLLDLLVLSHQRHPEILVSHPVLFHLLIPVLLVILLLPLVH